MISGTVPGEGVCLQQNVSIDNAGIPASHQSLVIIGINDGQVTIKESAVAFSVIREKEEGVA